MRYLGLTTGLLAIGAIVSVSNGCSSSDCTFDQTCLDTSASLDGGDRDGSDRADAVADAVGDRVSVDAGADGDTALPCNGVDLTLPPATGGPCVVTDDLAVFVSASTGADGAAGTKAAPLKKLADGIDKAKAAGKRVYVCAGTYDEHLVVGTTRDGARVFGGLRCTDWSYAASGTTVSVAPSTAGYALKIDTLTTGATFEDVTFISKDGALAGDSSIAVFVNASQAVIFRRTTMNAGSASGGSPGAAASNYASILQSDPKIAGNSANGTAPGGTQACLQVCTNGAHGSGGRGGLGDVAAPGDGLAGTPNLSGTAPSDGLGGAAGTAAACGNGHTGAAPASAAGGAGASSSGALTASGWSPTPGQDGTFGAPAQGGGGGGGGLSATTGGGGGGGCGGCGGAAGTTGKGGGASFALATVASVVTLDKCNLVAAKAGDGGKGGDGQSGQKGGFAGVSSPPGCNGGQGGNGGDGGGGGGGAGGLSVAIAYSGSAPTEQNGTTKAVGSAGAGGAAGSGGTPAATAGKPGVAQPTMQF